MEEKKNLSIYVFKTKKKYGDDWDEQSIADKEQYIIDITKKYDKFVKTLEKADEGDYDDIYVKGMEKLVKEIRFPYVCLSSVGVAADLSITPQILSDVRDNRDKVLMGVKFTAETDFIGAQTFIRLFTKYSQDTMFWITPEMVDELIETCNKAGKSKKAARETIPTDDGKYEDDYFDKLRAFRTKLKHLKSLQKKGYLLYAAAIKS